ncbi:endonuclease/exonuclease/phosphatase family protein [Streptomyces samsunensis]|uniref:endonuclease/exonuclease/phosphatase family protein n=1 Tax=Streptomyces malaysiensis TaxID=92644 RepID=UPI00158413E7|nr:endonuclease/exonuclease/phosphatase family protein [Streptomyces samsunensis]NUH39743.1 endonuclease/exonuclease/phosphatase family protein [Streptomyces samsunensis]
MQPRFIRVAGVVAGELPSAVPAKRNRRRASAIVLGLAAAVLASTGPAGAAPGPVNAAPVPANAASGPVSSTRAPVVNRVMSWNLHAGGEDVSAQAREVARLRPQVIGFQEACRADVKEIQSQLKRMGLTYYVAYGTVRGDRWNCGLWGGNAFGQAVLSATPIVERGNQLYSQGGTEERGYMWVRTMVNGKATWVYNTHLAQAGQRTERARQVAELTRATRSRARAVILGDFNAEPQYAELGGMWSSRFRDADPDCGRAENYPACAPTADANPRRKKFDYIWLRGITAPGGNTVVGSPHSDHDMVYAGLR